MVASHCRPHRNILVTLPNTLRILGPHIDRERYCADLISYVKNGESREAWLDVCAYFPGHEQLWRLDITSRSPWLQNGRARWTPGVAAPAGVTAKAARYNESVTAISMEPLGRMIKKKMTGVTTNWKELKRFEKNWQDLKRIEKNRGNLKRVAKN